MSIEISIQNLADAINNLASAYSGAAPAKPAEAAPEADPPKRGRGRPAKEDATPAAASGTSSEDDTASAATATSADKVVVDAGTGQPIAAPAAGDDLRARCKAEGVKLAAAPEGGEKLTGLLRKHSGIADGPAPGFSKVPDAALPAFLADVQAELAMAG